MTTERKSDPPLSVQPIDITNGGVMMQRRSRRAPQKLLGEWRPGPDKRFGFRPHHSNSAYFFFPWASPVHFSERDPPRKPERTGHETKPDFYSRDRLAAGC